MEIVKSNMTDMVPFQLLYYGVSNGSPTCTSVTIVGIPIANLFTGYFSTYRVTVDADSVTNNAVCQSGVTTEIPINQAYIGGDTANISINVII